MYDDIKYYTYTHTCDQTTDQIYELPNINPSGTYTGVPQYLNSRLHFHYVLLKSQKIPIPPCSTTFFFFLKNVLLFLLPDHYPRKIVNYPQGILAPLGGAIAPS